MPTLLTSLHEDYQLNTWNIRDAVRELISNAMDGEARNLSTGVGKMELSHTRSENLIITNHGITVPTKSLLMGTSVSRGYNECIGTFGEGLPMALLVLSRMNIPVVIENGDEKWEPEIVDSPEYNTRVLGIHTRKLPKGKNHFSVRIGDISKIMYDSYRSLFLRFDTNMKIDQVLSSPSNGHQILLQPEYKGKIYNRGVYVHTRDDVLFGYNVNMQLNRDRSFVDTWDLKQQLKSLIYNVTREADAEPEKIIQVMEKLVFSTPTLETEDDYGDLYCSEQVRSMIEQQYKLQWANKVPARNQQEADDILALGESPAVVPPLVYRIMQQTTKTVEDLRKARFSTPVKVYRTSELDPTAWGRVVKLMTLLKPHVTRPGVLKVVDFAQEQQRYVLAEDKTTILLAKSTLDYPKDLVRYLTQAVNERNQGHKAFHNLELDLMSSVISELL